MLILKEMLFERIQQKIWELSVSAGMPPYTFISFMINEESKMPDPTGSFDGYTQGIAFFIWEEYSLEEYRDYLEHSREYMQIGDEHRREQFLLKQMENNKSRNNLLQWQHNQMHIAFGIALNELRSSVEKFKEVEVAEIGLFRHCLQIRGGILREVILWN